MKYKNLENFLAKLKMPNQSFGIKGLDLSTVKPYEYEKYDCEIALLHKCSDKGDGLNPLLCKTFKQVFSKEYLELYHPIYNHVLSRAVLSFNNSLVANGENYNRFVFFVDEKNQHPWILINENMFARIIITQEGLLMSKDLFRISGFAKWILWLCLDQLPKIVRNLEPQRIAYCDQKFAISLANSRPYHFFLEDLYWFYYLGLDECSVLQTPMFFKGDRVKNIIKSTDRLSIRPSLLVHNDGANFLKNEIVALMDNNMPAWRGADTYSLTLWFGIPGQRRTWLEQWEGIPLILKNLSQYFPSIKVFVDGMTAYDGERIEVKENLQDFWKIVENTKRIFGAKDDAENTKNSSIFYGASGEKIAFKSLSGYDYRTKICYCAMCDIVISETNTTALTPFIFCKKPGVAFYCIEDHISFTKNITQDIAHIRIPDKQYFCIAKSKIVNFNYHIPPQYLYNLAAEVLEELSRENKLKVKNLKMHRLEVPPVELIAKQYELEKQFEVKIPLENVEFVDKLATQLHQKDQIIQTKTQELTQTKNQLDSAKKELDSTKQQLDSKTKELSSLPIKKQTLEIKNLEQDLINKQLHTKQLEKELGYESNVLKELELKNQKLIQTKNQLDFTKKQLESTNKILFSNPNSSHLIQNTSNFKGKLAYLNTLTTAKDRIHNHLSYKLGQAMIENSKSLLGYIRMPYVLSYIKDKHKQEQQQYQEAIKKNPNLKLPNLESYPDYQESLKEKECLTYKLGEAFIKADKTWYKGGYVKLWFEVRELKRRFKDEYANKNR